MSVLEESRKNFKSELRQFVSVLTTTADVANAQRQRIRLRQKLSEVRRAVVAVTHPALTASAAGTIAACPSSATTTMPLAASTPFIPPPGSAKSKAKGKTSHPSAVPSAAASSTCRPRSPLPLLGVEMDAALLFAEECVAAAGQLMARGLHEEALDICLEPMEREVRQVLREAIARAPVHRGEELLPMVAPPPDGAARRTLRFVERRPKQTEVTLSQARRLVTQYDLMRHVCQCYVLCQLEVAPEEVAELLGRAMGHAEAAVAPLLTLAEVDADESYFVLFNGTIMVYEMCLQLLRQADAATAVVGAERKVLDDVLASAVRHVAMCLELCESGTLKLATVRYVPWRMRLYDFLATCYERQGLYAEALVVVQRASRKLRELIDLEFLDPVLPPQVSRDTLLLAFDHVMLNLLRYTWYVNSGAGQSGESGLTARQPAVAVSHAQASISLQQQQQQQTLTGLQEPPLGEMPMSGFDMVDRAWKLLLQLKLPRHSRQPAVVQPETETRVKGSGKGKGRDRDATPKKQEQETAPMVTLAEREAVAERSRGALVQFLLSFASSTSQTADSQESVVNVSAREGNSVASLRTWAVEALEYMAHHAVYQYVTAKPSITSLGPSLEFQPNEIAPPPLPPPVVPFELSTGRKKSGANSNSSTRRGNKGGNAATAASAAALSRRLPSALEDNAFMGGLTVELLLRQTDTLRAWPGVATTSSNQKMELPEEESHLLLLVLHRVLYDARNARLFGRLCTCSIDCLQQWRDDEARKSASPGSRRAIRQHLLETSHVALRLLQQMRRIETMNPGETCIADLANMAKELKRLSELYGGSVSSTVMLQGSTFTGGSSTLPLLCVVPSASSSFAAVHQRILEEGANFLRRRVQPFAASLTIPGGGSRDGMIGNKNSGVLGMMNSDNNKEQTGNVGAAVDEKNATSPPIPAVTAEGITTTGRNAGEDAQEALDMYYTIVCTFLEAKVTTSITDVIGIGQLVLEYASQVEADLSIDGPDASRSSNSGSQDAMVKDLRKTCERTRMALSAVQMALGCMVRRQMRPFCAATTSVRRASTGTHPGGAGATLIKRPGHTPCDRNPPTSTVTTHTTGIVAGALKHTSARSARRDDVEESSFRALTRHRREEELRDTRTELTRRLVQLRWHYAAHRERYAALEKHKADVRTLTERHAKSKIYGAVTAKESNILQTVLREGPVFSRTSEDEKTRLLAWARDEGDELLRALILICLVPYQLQPKVQREMMEEAFHLLRRCESGQGRHGTVKSVSSNTGHARAISPTSCHVGRASHEESTYSTFMVWCYAITVCGRLGFTNMAECAKDVLYAVFAKGDSGNDTTQETNFANLEATKKETEASTFKGHGNRDTAAILAVQPNEEVLSVASPLLVRTLVSALLWMSTVEMRRGKYQNFDITGLFPYTGRGFLLDVPFQNRYGIAETQLCHLRSGYRLQFAIQLADRVRADELMLQCAFELFNALLPTLTDANFNPLILQPLSTLCTALVRQPPSVWSDTEVQLLAARILDAVLKTVQKMESAPVKDQLPTHETNFDVPVTNEVTPSVAGTAAVPSVTSALGDSKYLATVPTTITGWYELLLRVFLHVWTQVYAHPNPRQLRHMKRVEKGAKAIQRVIGTDKNECGMGEGTNTSPVAQTSKNASKSRPGRATNTTAAAAGGTAASATGASATLGTSTGNVVSDGEGKFPGSGYAAVAEPLIDDRIPIEFLELLSDILFTVPGGANACANASNILNSSAQPNNTALESTMPLGRKDRPLDRTARFTGNSGGLDGVPIWLLDVARSLNGRTTNTAIERLQQSADDPLYARTAVRVVEHLLRYGDTSTARRLANDALLIIRQRHEALQQYEASVMAQMLSWLQREGFVLLAPTKSARRSEAGDLVQGKEKNVSTIAPASQSNARGGSISTTFTASSKSHEVNSSSANRQWSPAEQQMLRQLTRGFALLRRRRSFAWLRGRMMQFNAPFQAQLHLYLSTMVQLILERRRRLAKEGEQSLAISLSLLRQGGKGRQARSGAPAPEDKGVEEPEEKGMEEHFVEDAGRAAVLFNRCGFPTRAFAAIVQAADGLRAFVCEDPPDLTLRDEVLLQQHQRHLSTSVGEFPAGQSSRQSDIQSVDSTNMAGDTLLFSPFSSPGANHERLTAWAPRVQPLVHSLYVALQLVWLGAVDHRRDIEYLQPAAVKVGRDVELSEQLHVAGRVPSLHTAISPAGRYEEARLAHLAAIDGRRQYQALQWRLEEMFLEEVRGRLALRREWITELSSLVESPSAAVIAAITRELDQCDTETSKIRQQEQENLQGQRRRLKYTKRRTNGRSETLPEPVHLNGADAVVLLALRLGSSMPAEKILTQLMFLLRYMQCGRQLAAVRLATEVHHITKSLFARTLLPFILSLQKSIGAWQANDDLVTEYAQVCRDEPAYRVLMRTARRLWETYTTTENYRRAMQRLARTLLPSARRGEGLWTLGTSFVDGDASSVVSGDGNLSRRVPDEVLPSHFTQTRLTPSQSKRSTLRDVTDAYASSADYLRQRRLFGPLTECLYELGRIFLLHRHRAEAERCWLEAVDAALETPESLQQPLSSLSTLPVTTIGLPRILIAVLTLSSLAMYIYREDQRRAVDAYLLAARVLERFFEQGATSSFSQNLRDYGGFALEDLIVLPHLGDSLQTLMPSIVHHMLFLAEELLRFKFPLYAAMVASVTEFLARTHTRHIGLTIEARLIQANAAARFGHYAAAMKLLCDACHGVRIPSGALDATALRLRPVLECGETTENTPGRGKGGRKVLDNAEGDRIRSSTLRDQVTSGEGLYCNAELPTDGANMTCIPLFMSRCFPNYTIPQGGGASSGTGASNIPSLGDGLSGGASSGLHESVAARYGPQLSIRVELAVADALVALGSKEAAYVWSAFATPPTGATAAMTVAGSATAVAATAAGGTGGGGGGAEVSRRSAGRTRSTLRVPLHGFTSSACLDALAAAEQILQSLLHRLHVRAAPVVETHTRGKGGSAREKVTTTILGSTASGAGSHNTGLPGEDLQARRTREAEEFYLRGTSELLLARVFTARGEYTRAVALLQSLVTNVGEHSGHIGPIIGVPSFLWTLPTHTFWCEVYELMVLNHVRLCEYEAARGVVQEALGLCDQCGDPYTGRVFSLYGAAIAARRGAAVEAMGTLQELRRVSTSLASEGRIDLMRAWTVMAAEVLNGGNRQANKTGQEKGSNMDNNGLESAVAALREYCEENGLLPDSLSALFTAEDSKFESQRLIAPQRPLIAWNVEAVLLHRSLNHLAALHMRRGKPCLAEGLLCRAIFGLAGHYDTAVHPTPLVESRILLARVLCLANPSLLETQRKRMVTDVEEKEVLAMEEDVIHALDIKRQKPVRLLLDAAQLAISGGTHDYDMLRMALLHLAVLLARAGRPFHIMGATCTVLARITEDMKFNVFSGTTAFNMYNDDSIQLGSDVMFGEMILAVIHSVQRGLGYTAEKAVPGAEGSVSPNPTNTNLPGGMTTTSPTINVGTGDSKRNFANAARDKNAPRSLVTLPTMIAAFAALHRERALQYVSPPLESLDLETALRHVRAFLQLRTAPISLAYAWYSETTREVHLRQLQQQQQQPGRVGGQRGGGGGGTNVSMSPLLADGGAGGPVSLLPPILMDSLPQLLLPATLQQLGVPKANTVIFQSFIRDGSGSHMDTENSNVSNKTTAADRKSKGAQKKSKTKAKISSSLMVPLPSNNSTSNSERTTPHGASSFANPTVVTFVLFLSPLHDTSVTQPPTLGERTQQAQGRKVPRTTGGGGGGANTTTLNSTTNSTTLGTGKNTGTGTAASAAATTTTIDGKTGDASSSAGLGVTSLSHPWSGTQCIVYELPLDEVIALQAQAAHTLELLQSPPTHPLPLPLTSSPSPTNASGEDVPVASLLAQQLGEAFTVLLAKSTSASSGGRKTGRTATAIDALFNNSASGNASPTKLPPVFSQLESGNAAGGGENPFATVTDANAGVEVSAVDDAKCRLVMGFIELLVRSVMPRAVSDDELMESCVQRLLPKCVVSEVVVRFLHSMLARDGGAASLFNPGVYEWFARVAAFVTEHA